MCVLYFLVQVNKLSNCCFCGVFCTINVCIVYFYYLLLSSIFSSHLNNIGITTGSSSMKDLKEVIENNFDARNEWYNLGIALDISSTDLTSMKDLFRAMLEY